MFEVLCTGLRPRLKESDWALQWSSSEAPLLMGRQELADAITYVFDNFGLGLATRESCQAVAGKTIATAAWLFSP